MGKTSKSSSIAGGELVGGVKKHKKDLEEESKSNDFKCDESVTITKDKQAKRKIIKEVQTDLSDDEKKNKKIIFHDDEPVEVENPQSRRKKGKVQLSQEKEEDIKDEDIDKFCDELNEEDNEQYESWVKLLEAKLHPNKKKTK